jgi:hypothetical protein
VHQGQDQDEQHCEQEHGYGGKRWPFGVQVLPGRTAHATPAFLDEP